MAFTRGKVIEVGEAAGITCHQSNFSLFDVYGADEAFVTGTFGGLTPVTSVDGRAIGTGGMGPKTEQLQELYAAAVEMAVAEAKASNGR
jgi:branched-chain amino acid aminotransferase